MSKPEMVLFLKYIRQSRYYLEFGMGGSTILALSYSKAKIYCIESDLQWISKFKKSWYIRWHLLRRLSVYYSNIGETKKWGYPLNQKHRLGFPGYSSDIFKKMDASKVDLALIDGRFRVACALQTVMHCHKNQGLTILFHDFYNRQQYHSVLKYLDEFESIEKLAAFAIKKGINLVEVQADYEVFKYDAS